MNMGEAIADLAHLHCVRPFDLLTRRTVGSLELYSLFADADHFIHREQALCLDVTNTIG
jgi:hypothetical protein